MDRQAWTDDDWRLIRAAVVRMRTRAMALACGAFGGCALFMMTAWLLIKGGEGPIGPHLSLLGQYFPGYSVTWPGAILGLVYGGLTGALLGWLVARIYNGVASRSRGA